MRVKATTRVRSMVRTYPQLEDVLGWHDIEVDDDILAMSIVEVCDEFGLDLDEVLEDIQAALRDSAGEAWPVERDEDDEDDDSDSEYEELEREREAASPPEEDDVDLDDDDDEEEDFDDEDEAEGDEEEPEAGGDWE